MLVHVSVFNGIYVIFETYMVILRRTVNLLLIKVLVNLETSFRKIPQAEDMMEGSPEHP